MRLSCMIRAVYVHIWAHPPRSDQLSWLPTVTMQGLLMLLDNVPIMKGGKCGSLATNQQGAH